MEETEILYPVSKCINTDLLSKNGYKPNLKLGKEYKVIEDIICGCGQHHYDVGLKTKLNFISCYKCGEELPVRQDIHWCNSIRFELV